jgi:rhodanese-related sulfurtransferase
LGVKLFTLLTALAMVALAVSALAAGSDVARMTTEELEARLGEDGLTVVDSRLTHQFEAAKTKVKGAVRGDPGEIEQWSAKLDKDKPVVVYCS